MKLNVCAQAARADDPSGAEPTRMGAWQAAQPQLAEPAELPVNGGKGETARLETVSKGNVLRQPQMETVCLGFGCPPEREWR